MTTEDAGQLRQRQAGRIEKKERRKDDHRKDKQTQPTTTASSFTCFLLLPLAIKLIMEQQFMAAADAGRVEEVESLLRDHPGINVNWANEIQWTPLHNASKNGHAEVVKLLLAHPQISLNVRTSAGQTPFSLGCEFGHVSVTQLFLKDPRVDVILDDKDEHTPLWWASIYGRYEVAEWLIASGRRLGGITKKGKMNDGQRLTPLEVARRREKWDVALLLERFMVNREQTRHELRVKLGVLTELAAEIFALAVFLCDDLLQLRRPALSSQAATVRFFAIAKKLPMELQMLLSRRVVGSAKDNILSKDAEAAFKDLAGLLLRSSQSE